MLLAQQIDKNVLIVSKGPDKPAPKIAIRFISKFHGEYTKNSTLLLIKERYTSAF